MEFRVGVGEWNCRFFIRNFNTEAQRHRDTEGFKLPAAGAEERKEVAIVMKFKIVSGGQTGVDRAGLEAAIALGLPYGGWVPKGRLAEDGVVPLKYVGMQEHTSSNYAVRTKANVRDSDATLIIAPSLPLSRGTMLTLRTAERLPRPHHVACLVAANAMDDKTN